METKGEKSNDRDLPQQHQPHPAGVRGNLSPDHLAGQNAGTTAETDREIPLRTAFDEKPLHRRLAGRFTDDELKQVPLVPPGARLEQGATYADLAADAPEEIRPTGAVAAREGQLWVAKDRVPYWIWNRLIGEPKPGQE